MNIIIFTYSVTRIAGGVFDAVRDLFTNASFKQENLKILSFKDKYSDVDLPTWNNLPIQLFRSSFMLHSSKAKRSLLTSEADILHMEALWRCPQLWMVDWKRKYKNRPIVCSPHGMLDPYIIKSQGKFKRFVSRLLFQKSLEAVDCYHALCHKEMEDIRAYGLKQPIAIIPNGINLPNTTKAYPRKDNKLHLLYLGRLHRKKGVDILLNAFVQIKNENPEYLDKWHLDLVGWDHENCKKELEKIVNEGNLQNEVTFHGGLFGEDKLQMYATSDAYILPSHGEGLPMTVLEAWSWKLPVIMTEKCNLPEGFSNNAAIKIEDTVESTKQGIIRLLNMSDSERTNMGNNGYKLVKEQFTWNTSAKKMIEVYKWLINKSNKPNFVY